MLSKPDGTNQTFMAVKSLVQLKQYQHNENSNFSEACVARTVFDTSHQIAPFAIDYNASTETAAQFENSKNNTPITAAERMDFIANVQSAGDNFMSSVTTKHHYHDD